MASNHDGKVVISTALDNSGVDKGLKEVAGEFGGLKNVLDKSSAAISEAMSKPVSQACAKIRKDIEAAQKQIERYQQQIQKSESAKMPLTEQAEQLGAELDAAKRKLAELQAQQQAAGNLLSAPQNRELSPAELGTYLDVYEQKPKLDESVIQQQAQVDKLQKSWDKVNNEIDSYNSKIDQAGREVTEQKSKVTELTKKLDVAEKEAKQLRANASGAKKEFSAMSKPVNSFVSRLKSITMGALLFNGISAGLRVFTSYLGKSLKTNENFTKELSQLKGALLTAFQPIYNAIAPAVTYLIRLLTGATLAVADFFAAITGTTIESSAEAAKGLYEEANALESVGKTAEKARKSLAGFDELNVLQDKSESSSSSGNSDVTAPDFAVSDWGTGELEKIKETFKDIAEYIGVAAAGILGFKLGSFIADLLTAGKEAKSLKKAITQLGKKAGLIIGVTLAVTGIALETKGIADAIQNELSQANLLEILGGGAAITAGGAMIGQFFGKGVLGGAVGAIVGGIPAYITGIYDACMNGLNWMNAALVAAASTMAGAGIGMVVGSIGGPLGAAVGLLVGLFTDWLLLLKEQVTPAAEGTTTKTDALTEAEKRLVSAVDESARKFRDQKAATDEALGDISGEMSNADKLAGELFKLADSSGKVAEKDKARADLILGKLNEALGTEYKMVGDVIQNYDTLKGSIDEVIKSKAAHAMLEAANGNYIAALQGEEEAWNSLQITQKDYETARASSEQNIKNWQAEIEKLRQKQVNGVGILTAAENIELSNQIKNLSNKIKEEKNQLAIKQAAYEEDRKYYEELQKTLNKYEAAHEAAMKGNYQTTVDILTNKSQLYTDHTGVVEDESAQVLAALEKEAYDAGEEAKLTKELFENGVAGYTEEIVAEAENGYQEALGKWASAYSDAHGLGKDFGQGLADGIEAQNGIVAGAAITQIREAIAAARKEADSHSPSKKTIALGEDIGVGPGIGIENETDSAVKAAENQMDAVIDAYESKSAANSGKSFGSTFADGIYSSIKSIANAGSTAAKAAMNAINGTQGAFAIPSWRVSTPKIPHLATGAVLPANKPFLAMVGDQKHGTNIEAPLATIQEAVALVMGDQTAAILAGFEASVGVQREILEAVLGIQIGDDVIGRATARYNSKLAVMRGGV